MELADERDERIFLEALTTYADSCKLPELTTTCPFYRYEDGHATCNEECRSVLERNGVNDRPVVDVMVDGLQMTGRRIPAVAAAGIDEFDATQSWLQERDQPVAVQSTSSLLIGLGVAARWNLGRAVHDPSVSLTFWGELSRRGVEMDGVFRGGITRELAKIATIRALAEILTRDGIVDATPLLGDTHPGSFPMGDLVDVALKDMQADPHVWIDPNIDPLLSVLEFRNSQVDGERVAQEVLMREDIQFVISQGFSLRMEEWFAGLASHDLEAALAGELPSPELFRSTPGRPRGHTIGRWLWERFTVTDPATWHPSSLLLEWQWVRGTPTDACDQRVMHERHLSVDQISSKTMEAFEIADSDAPEVNLFQPAKYVQLASNHLSVGEWEKAAQIFAGLVALSPGDGEAWNNWGFCLLGDSAAEAMPRLERAASLQRPVSVISTANQAIALHLLGQDDEAIRRADAVLSSGRIDPHGTATVWLHPAEEGELELGHTTDTHEYLSDLRAHIARHDCTAGGMDVVTSGPQQEP